MSTPPTPTAASTAAQVPPDEPLMDRIKREVRNILLTPGAELPYILSRDKELPEAEQYRFIFGWIPTEVRVGIEGELDLALNLISATLMEKHGLLNVMQQLEGTPMAAADIATVVIDEDATFNAYRERARHTIRKRRAMLEAGLIRIEGPKLTVEQSLHHQLRIATRGDVTDQNELYFVLTTLWEGITDYEGKASAGSSTLPVSGEPAGTAQAAAKTGSVKNAAAPKRSPKAAPSKSPRRKAT